MTMFSSNSRVFVPNGESRKDTAVLLVGTARDLGLDTRTIRSVSGGFLIPDDLADVLYDEPEIKEAPEVKQAPKKSTSKKASGNRAAKKNSTEEE